MLQFFPTPYPDELWYSVLCRYHVRTGNANSAITFRELFGKDHAAVGSFLPNGLIYDVTKQLPEGTIDVEDMELNHTLFKYIFRIQLLEVKQKLLQTVKHEKIDFPIKIGKPYEFMGLKSCPVCMQEDLTQYGETYWHLKHQIPYVSICQRHKCRLITRQREYKNELNNNFILPDTGGIQNVDYNIFSQETVLTEVLTQYLELPLETGPTDGYSNLYEGLINAGYGIARKDNNYTINFTKISKDLCFKFGEEFINHHFGSTYLTAAVFGQIRNWLRKFPERYAILAVFIGQTPEVTFSNVRIRNQINQQFLELSKKGVCYSKKYVCEFLGVTEHQLDVIAHNLDVKPFWRQKLRLEVKNDNLSLTLSKAERKTIESYVEQYGFSSASAFLLYCMEQTIKRME